MSSIVEIPLSPASQQFTIALGQTQYQLALNWRGTVSSSGVGTGPPAFIGYGQGGYGEGGYGGYVLNPSAALQGWVMDILDASANPIVSGIPLVTGRDLLAQYAHLGIGPNVQLWALTDGNPSAVPTGTNLGIDSHLYVVTP